jgi:hypothetical protein
MEMPEPLSDESVEIWLWESKSVSDNDRVAFMGTAAATLEKLYLFDDAQLPGIEVSWNAYKAIISGIVSDMPAAHEKNISEILTLHACITK